MKQYYQIGWWPASGYRHPSAATLHNIGNNGNYWSSSQSSATNAYNLNFNYNAGVNPSNNNNRSHGFSVRCIEEPTTLYKKKP